MAKGVNHIPPWGAYREWCSRGFSLPLSVIEPTPLLLCFPLLDCMFLVYFFLLYKGKHTRDPSIPLTPTRQEQHLSSAETECNNSLEC